MYKTTTGVRVARFFKWLTAQVLATVPSNHRLLVCLALSHVECLAAQLLCQSIWTKVRAAITCNVSPHVVSQLVAESQSPDLA